VLCNSDNNNYSGAFYSSGLDRATGVETIMEIGKIIFTGIIVYFILKDLEIIT